MDRSLPPWLIVLALGGILLIVAAQSLFPGSSIPAVANPPAEQDCVGEPIFTTYPYQGGMLDPWECKVQCDDKRQRYIVYTNNVATPCEQLPGCLDWGEDYGIKCRMQSTTNSK